MNLPTVPIKRLPKFLNGLNTVLKNLPTFSLIGTTKVLVKKLITPLAIPPNTVLNIIPICFVIGLKASFNGFNISRLAQLINGLNILSFMKPINPPSCSPVCGL